MPVVQSGTSLPRVAVLYGGESALREVSLEGGIQVAAALEEAGCAVRAFDMLDVDLRDIDWRNFDVAYIGLQGGTDEDGRVQNLLSALGVPFTGSDAAACEIAMSKRATKKRLRAHGVPTAPWRVLAIEESLHDWLRQAGNLGFPLAVKPNGQGGSLGVGAAHDIDELQNCLAESFQYDSQVIVEPLLTGREFSVSVIDRRPLPLLEVVSEDRIYDYAAKFDGVGAEFLTEADGDPTEASQIKRIAVQACAALGTSGLAKVDLRCDSVGRPYVLEINTSPSMTTESLVLRALRLADLSVAECCFRLVEEAMAIAAGGETS